ncbi:GPR1/FUN34/YaaH-class plasma membrane protein [Penicillium hispanicum]|uniref:GPR1/FUN34/YaaH-class plasma membrane protein n=1 Tax=Penicillium hispanicum TaxID=1080232 RepID=UPI002541EC14|nr:GPR1/FUN34/YaaH-class plasma membrane protein [Penicillium hispanicum]KAJ5594826.1 GPR1/FUN34/YaaH-class plasma membrane protein [Penicillium hispanicum]
MLGKEGVISRDGSSSSQSEAGAMPALMQAPTSVTLSAEQFEKLYLSPMMHRQPAQVKSLGNPTPLGIGAFVLTATPLSCCLMSWRGAGGSGAAFSSVLILFGGLLLVLSSVLEFILGNTFSSVVFGHLGAFCLAFGGSMTPAFNSAAPYSPDGTNTLAGLHSPGFLDTFGTHSLSPRILATGADPVLLAFFFIFMALLMLIYTICATRINVLFVLIFMSLIVVFCLLAAAYWNLGAGDEVMGNRLTVGAGAALFLATMLGFWLLTAQLLDSVGFPLSLPVGDLSGFWLRLQKRSESESAAGGKDPR